MQLVTLVQTCCLATSSKCTCTCTVYIHVHVRELHVHLHLESVAWDSVAHQFYVHNVCMVE